MDIDVLYRGQREYFMKGHTLTAEFRIRQCEILRKAVLEYEPDAPKGTWVMKTADGQALERAYDAWPQFIGDLAPTRFSR